MPRKPRYFTTPKHRDVIALKNVNPTTWISEEVPIYPNLLELFRWILKDVKAQGHKHVLWISYRFTELSQGIPVKATVPCRDLDFRVTPMTRDRTMDLTEHINRHWTYWGPKRRTGEPYPVALYSPQPSAPAIHLQVHNRTHLLPTRWEGEVPITRL